MKNIILSFFLLSIFWVGCLPPGQLQGNKFVYSHKLVGDNVKDSIYQDDALKIIFTVTNKEIDFVMYNNSPNPIKIIWDEGSFIQYGEGKRIMHKSVKYADRDASQVPTTVPSKTMWSDLIVPTENVYYRQGYTGTLVTNYGGWETKDIWPAYDLRNPKTAETVMALKGLKYSVLLPMEVNGAKRNYTFNFEITDIIKTPYQPKPPKAGLPF